MSGRVWEHSWQRVSSQLAEKGSPVLEHERAWRSLCGGHSIIIIMCYFADAFIKSKSNLQLIRLSRGKWSNMGFFSQGPNSCVDLIITTPGLEPPTFRVPVIILSY